MRQSAEHDAPGSGKNGSGTIGKSLAVLDLVARHARPVRFGVLLQEADFPKATLYRLLQTLVAENLLSYDPEQQTYAPGLRLVRLAHSAWATASLAPIARPHLDALSAATGHTVHLAQLDAAQVLYVDKRNAREPIPMFSQAGKVGPAYCTGVGKAMLAFLPEADLGPVLAQQSYHVFTPGTLATRADLEAELTALRARGHAYDREEHETGIICIAHPIRTATGRVLGAISITGTTAHMRESDLDAFVPLLRETSGQIAREAESWRFPDTNT